RGVRAFRYVVHIVEPEANGLTRPRHGKSKADAIERMPRRGGSLRGQKSEGRQIPVIGREPLAQIAWNARIYGLQIDNLALLHQSEMQGPTQSKTGDFHVVHLCFALERELSPARCSSKRPRLRPACRSGRFPFLKPIYP